MERRRPQRPKKTCRVVLGQKAMNSASQVRKSREGPNTSVRVLETYHSSLLPYSKPRLPLIEAMPGISRQTTPRELYRSELRE